MTLRAWLLALVAALGGGFLAGRWSIPREAPRSIIVGAAKPLPERDLSPLGEVRTVIVTRTVPGKPEPPPAAVPPELGKQLETTSTGLAPLPQGGTFHTSLFGQVDGQRLTLRTVEWLDTPQGRAPLGEARTVTAETTLTLPPHAAPPRWGAVALAGLQSGRPVYGAALSYWRGPLVFQAGAVGNVAFIGAGVRW